MGPMNCRSCNMEVAHQAPHVTVPDGLYHRECFEAWYFGRHGSRPRLRTVDTGGPRYTLRGSESVAARR